jgi:hypothetical protein
LKFWPGKCGFASQPERLDHATNRDKNGNAIRILT